MQAVKCGMAPSPVRSLRYCHIIAAAQRSLPLYCSLLHSHPSKTSQAANSHTKWDFQKPICNWLSAKLDLENFIWGMKTIMHYWDFFAELSSKGGWQVLCCEERLWLMFSTPPLSPNCWSGHTSHSVTSYTNNFGCSHTQVNILQKFLKGVALNTATIILCQLVQLKAYCRAASSNNTSF